MYYATIIYEDSALGYRLGWVFRFLPDSRGYLGKDGKLSLAKYLWNLQGYMIMSCLRSWISKSWTETVFSYPAFL